MASNLLKEKQLEHIKRMEQLQSSDSTKKTTFTRSAAGKRRHSSAFDNSTPQALMEVRYDLPFSITCW